MLSRDESVPHFLRMFGATPAMYLLAGVGVWETIRVLRDRFMREQAKWAPHWIRDDTKTATVVGALVGGLILIQGAHTYPRTISIHGRPPRRILGRTRRNSGKS